MARLYDTSLRLLEYLCALIFMALLVVLVIQVTARYGFDSPPFWTEELARYTLVWLTFMAAVICQHHREHVSADVLIALLPTPIRRIADLLISLVALVTLVFLAKSSFDIIGIATQRSPALDLLMGWVYTAPAVGLVLMTIITVVQIGQQISDLFKEAR